MVLLVHFNFIRRHNLNGTLSMYCSCVIHILFNSTESILFSTAPILVFIHLVYWLVTTVFKPTARPPITPTRDTSLILSPWCFCREATKLVNTKTIKMQKTIEMNISLLENLDGYERLVSRRSKLPQHSTSLPSHSHSDKRLQNTIQQKWLHKCPKPRGYCYIFWS